ncbi:MAG: hypothetical protein QNK23_09960 [Crocinitomicaceae bacterium]|nr:hypothetical protein [Crocinitomicaceae bacterium]
MESFYKQLRLLTLIILVLFTVNTATAQNSCDGSMAVTPAIGNWGGGTQLGDGSPGNIEICISNNNLLGAGASCGGNSQFVLSTGNGSGIVVIWNQTTANGTCITINTGASGYAWIALNCELAGASCDITWSTVDGGGTSLCVETCTDGIMNQDETGIDCGGTFCVPCSCTNGVLDVGETGIDCGGPCNPCGTCFDGIQNGSETGVDCGGACALSCNTNNTSTPSTTCCDNAAQATVYPTNCDQIGTSAYNLNSPVVNFTTVGNLNCPPSGTSGCGSYNDNGQWIHLDLAAGVDYLQASFQSGSVSTGNHNVYATLFQGPDCSNLTEMADCQDFFLFQSGAYYVLEVSWSNLDPNQDVWLYLWDTSDPKENTFDIQFIGAAMNTNTACPGSAAIGDACNLGAAGASFTTPGAGGVACNGGNWGSNENTTFYSFTADATSGSLEIENIICNDGTNGNAQFAVWTDCSDIGSYGGGSGFLGCAVGTASITLSPLIPGQTYYIAADGFAGDNCTWSFTGTGIALPIELGSFTARHTGREVEVDWLTISEINNDYFTVQRTVDGLSYEDIGFVEGAGTTQERQEYSFVDYNPFKGTSYYRLKQTDFDGEFKYTDLVSVTQKGSNTELIKTINLMGQEVNLYYSGVVIDIYSDGTSTKRIQ